MNHDAIMAHRPLWVPALAPSWMASLMLKLNFANFKCSVKGQDANSIQTWLPRLRHENVRLNNKKIDLKSIGVQRSIRIHCCAKPCGSPGARGTLQNVTYPIAVTRNVTRGVADCGVSHLASCAVSRLKACWEKLGQQPHNVSGFCLFLSIRLSQFYHLPVYPSTCLSTCPSV